MTFARDTFAPSPQPSSPWAMLLAQTKLEFTLIIRNGEQLLLTLFIPVVLLIGLTVLRVGDFQINGNPVPRVDIYVPAIMAVAVMSTAFTGQAIAVGFDRRYGALKRLGATPLPKWGVIVGKSLAVMLVVLGQSVLLGLLGVALGWRPAIAGLILGAFVIAVGTITFACMGLLLGGTLKAEIVLALANLLWFVLVGIGSIVVANQALPPAIHMLARCLPSGALTEALTRATFVHTDWLGIIVLVAWAAVCGALASKFFKFT